MSEPEKIVVSTVIPLAQQKAKVAVDIVVGKDILELLTGAMYTDPLTVYREYVQNAVDSIEDALEAGMYGTDDAPLIEVHLDRAQRSIRIRDNGIGVPKAEFVKRLTAIGASTKRGTPRRGFRGVGRLAGLGYCRELIFRSKSALDQRVSELTWDGRTLRELLRDASYNGNLPSLIKEIAATSHVSAEGYPSHFFEVEMRGVTRIRNDLLLHETEVRRYLAEVAPVPFDPAFSFADEINSFLAAHGCGRSIRIHMNDDQGPVTKPFADSIPITDKAVSVGTRIELLPFEGMEDGLAAVGWVLHHDYLGSIPRAAAVAGIRLRSGNIQVGDHRLLDDQFHEPRFNGWCVGEIHVLSPRIVPNGRRDNFETNGHWQDLQGKLATFAAQLVRACRGKSLARNKMAKARQAHHSAIRALQALHLHRRLDIANEFSNETIDKTVAVLTQMLNVSEFDDDNRSELARLAKDIQEHQRKLKRNSRAKGALEFLPANQRRPYREVFAAMLTITDNAPESLLLIEQVLDKVQRRMKSRK